MKLQYIIMVLALMTSVSAFEIISPTNQEYDGEINLVLTHNESLQEISYKLNNETTFACTNCSYFTDILDLEVGEYTLEAEGILNNESYTDTVQFSVIQETLPVCDHNQDGVRDLSDVSIFSEIKDTFDVNDDGIHDLVDVGLYGQYNQNNTWCYDKFPIEEELPVCDHNGDGERDLSDVGIFGEIKDAFDVNNDGVHNLVDVGIYGNNNQNDTWCAQNFPQFTLEIEDPKSKEYDGTVPVEIESNKELDSISYEVDNVSESCEDCDELNDNLNLSDGNYTLIATGKLGAIVKEVTASFTVKHDQPQPVEFQIWIDEPENQTYDEKVEVEIYANKDLDEFSFEVDNVSESCEDCDKLSYDLELAKGAYTLTATGKLGNITKTKEVSFTVKFDVEENETDDDTDDGEPRFTVGLEKLPQAVAAGQYTDEELAEIIRDNELNPGVINRLIKTGELGEESLEAILETKHKPVGIFRKVWAFFGGSTDSYAENIYKSYELDDEVKQKIIAREDLPSKYKEEVREELQQKTAGASGKVPPGQAKKTVSIGRQYDDDRKDTQNIQETERNKKQDTVSQAERTEKSNKGNSKNKVPPGLAKKGNFDDENDD